MKIGLVLTNDCNLGCSYCYSPRQKQSLDTKTALEWVDANIDRCGPNDLVDINVIGGETFLKLRLLEEIVEHALKRAEHHPGGFSVSMTTNGTLVTTKPVRDFLERYGRYCSIGVSIDGTRDAHDSSRIFHSGAGSWDSAVKGFVYLKTLPLQAFDISATFAPATRHLLRDSMLFLAELSGPHKFSVSPTTDWLIPKDSAVGFVEDFKAVFRWLHQHTPGKSVHGLTSSTFNLKLWAQGERPSAKDNRINSPYWCHVGNCESFTVGAGGKFYPCNRFQNHDQMQLGSVVDGALVWLPEAEQRLTQLYDQFSDFPEDCQTCHLKPQCGYCIAAAYEPSEEGCNRKEWLAAQHHCGWTHARFLTALWWYRTTGQWHP